MKIVYSLIVVFATSLVLSSCGVLGKAKYGCKGNGKNVGAERVLSGEKLPKAKTFKA